MKKNAFLLAFLMLLLLSVSGCSNEGPVSQTEVGKTPQNEFVTAEADETLQSEHISYMRFEDLPDWIDNLPGETTSLNKLFIMSPQGEDIVMLGMSQKGLAQDWTDDGRLLAVGTYERENKITVWNFEDRIFYREQTFDLSDGQDRGFAQWIFEIGYRNYQISYVTWWRDQKGLYVILSSDFDYNLQQGEDGVLFCTLELPEKGGVYENKPINCRNFRDMIGNIPFFIIAQFKRSPIDQRLLVVLDPPLDAPRVFDTYLFDPASGEMEFILHGRGSDISPDGKKMLVSAMPGKEDCLVEYDIEKKTTRDLYCSEIPTNTSHRSSLATIRRAVYSPDGKTIAFDAQRNYQSLETVPYNIYKMDLETRQIEMLTVWGDGDAMSPLWQPYCEACKKATTEGTRTP